MNRDELARHLYIHSQDGASQRWLDAGAYEWDTGQTKPEDVADCYARADQMINKGEVPQ